MNLHGTPCTPVDGRVGAPCLLLHGYFCPHCGGQYSTSKDSIYKSDTGLVFASPWWPFCDLNCWISCLETTGRWSNYRAYDLRKLTPVAEGEELGGPELLTRRDTAISASRLRPPKFRPPPIPRPATLPQTFLGGFR